MNKQNDEIFDKLFEKGKRQGKLTVDEVIEAIDNDTTLLDNLAEFYDRCSEAGISIEDSVSTDTAVDIPVEISDNPVTAYLRDICQIPMLSANEERELGRLIKYGSFKEAKKARKKLVESNLRLSFSIAKKHSFRMSEPLMDIVQNGNIGLMKAAEKFDYEMGCKFSTYATYWITQSILRGYADTSRIIRLPVHMHEFANRVCHTRAKLEVQNGKAPSTSELAEFMKAPEEEVKKALFYSQSCVSLYTPIGDEEQDSQLIDFIPDENEKELSESIIDEISINELIDDAKKYLKEIELNIILKRYGFYDGRTRTLEEIAKEYHLTRERIRQIEARALYKIKKHIKDPDLFK